MPTSSERLRARAKAYFTAYRALMQRSDGTGDPLEAEECEAVADRLLIDYDRLSKLAVKRAEKEKRYEHRRKQG
jgi:hypothetical protein